MVKKIMYIMGQLDNYLALDRLNFISINAEFRNNKFILTLNILRDIENFEPISHCGGYSLRYYI